MAEFIKNAAVAFGSCTERTEKEIQAECDCHLRKIGELEMKNENNAIKKIAFQEFFVTLQHPRKDDGDTLRYCLPCRAERQLLF